jgi:hypothetical protein
VERKWHDALNMAAAEPQPWELEGPKKGRATSSRATAEKVPQGHKGIGKTVGAANVVTQQPPDGAQSPAWEAPAWAGRRCRVRWQTGCEGDHLVLQCSRLRELSLNERRKVLEASGLCMYCLRHSAELECYGQGGPTKPECLQPECGGRHTTGAHELLGKVDASVNLIAGDDYESDEDEEWYVNIIRVEEEGESQQEFNDSWLELDGEESEEEAGGYCPSACMRKDDSGLEEELEYFRDVSPPPEVEEVEKNRWWSPGPQGSESEEEDEEENQYLISLLMSEPKGESNSEETTQPRDETEANSDNEDRQALGEEPGREGEGLLESPHSREPLVKKRPRRREPRKRKAAGQHEERETVRCDAWLRELLTDSSEGESGYEYTRFAESGRWIAEMTGSRDRGQCRLEAREGDEGVNAKVTTTSRGECTELNEVGVVMSS